MLLALRVVGLHIYLQYNHTLWSGACQARTSTSSFFTRNNRYYSVNTVNCAMSMTAL